MVRLVFRPYTQVWKSICTSEFLRASTRVSPGFALLRHSSPSFGSQHACSHSKLSPEGSCLADPAQKVGHNTFVTHRVWHPSTRMYVRLLGPCFKTGQRKTFCHDHERRTTALSHIHLHRIDLNTTEWLPERSEYQTNAAHHNARPITMPPSQAREIVWLNYSLFSFGYISAISGTL